MLLKNNNDDDDDNNNNNINLKNYKFQYLLIIISTMIVLYFLYSKSEQNKLLKNIKYYSYHKNIKNIIIFIFLCICLQVILHWQGITVLLCGYLYGFKNGLILALITTIISSNITYFISRITTSKENKIMIDNKNSLKYVILSRIFPHHITSIFWGTTDIKYIYFLIGTLISLLFLLPIETYIGTIINITQLKNKLFNNDHLTLILIAIVIIIALYMLYQLKNYYIKDDIINIINLKEKDENTN